MAAPIIGAFVARFGLHWNFAIYAGLVLIGLVAAEKLQFGERILRVSFFGGVRELLTDRKWIVFLTIIFIAGNGSAVITSYLFVYLQQIGTSPTWMGWALTIATVAEFPAMLVAHRLLKRLGSNGLLTLGLAASALRCGLYGVISLPWLALVVQLTQFFTFPILLVAGVSYADENAPAGMGATAQSIFSSAFMGIWICFGRFAGRGINPIYRRPAHVLRVRPPDPGGYADLWGGPATPAGGTTGVNCISAQLHPKLSAWGHKQQI